MNRTKCYLMPLLVSGLMLGSAAYGQAAAGQTSPPWGDASRDRDVFQDTRQQNVQQPESVAGRWQQKGKVDDSELRQWGELQPAAADDQWQAGARPGQMGGMTAAPGIAEDSDVFILEQERGDIQGYWGPQVGIYGFRDEQGRMDSRFGEQQFGRRPGVYGFEGTAPGAARETPAALRNPVVHRTPVDESSSWRHGRNLVDDNIIQTHDVFQVDRDFYTKEWKVSLPPQVEHPRLHTIYDNEMTREYYSAWHGSPVVWTANSMIWTPMPETRNQLASSRQKWTYFDAWDTGNIRNAPTTFGTALPVTSTASSAGTGMDLYGFIDQDSGVRRDGTWRLGNQSLYWDDRDLLESGTVGVRYDSYGYVSPDGGSMAAPGVRMTDEPGDLYLNIPRSEAVSIYGVPAPNGDAAYGYREPEIYGYRDTDEAKKRDKRDKHETYRNDEHDRDVYGYGYSEECY